MDIICLLYTSLGRLKQKSDKVKAYQGNATKLKKFGNDEFDLTLVFGPMYHLKSAEEKLAALNEAKRVTKPGGYILVAYIMNAVSYTHLEIKTDLASIVKVIRENTDVPCAIGFGISTPKQAKKMADISDGAIVGSAIIKIIDEYGEASPKYVGEYVKAMKDAL